MFNQYKVIEQIGQGSFGRVFKVMNPNVNNRIEALKHFFINTKDTNIRKSFEKEIRSARLSHPNICEIYAVDKDKGFLTMKYVDGTDLKTLIGRGPLSWEETCYIARVICSALNLAHSEGVIHRDIKPSNILLDSRGNIYLTDFGIASLKEDDNTYRAHAGTIAYLAPEHLSESNVPPSPQTDIYSLGLVMYSCLTASNPFIRSSEKVGLYEVMERIRNTTPQPPSDFNPAIPDQVDTIVLTATEKMLDFRYRTTDQMLTDLEEVLRSQSELKIKKSLIRKIQALHAELTGPETIMISGKDTDLQPETSTEPETIIEEPETVDTAPDELPDDLLPDLQTVTVEMQSDASGKKMFLAVGIFIVILLIGFGAVFIRKHLAKPPELTVNVYPETIAPNSQILFDNRLLRKIKKLEPGKHLITVRAAGYKDYVGTCILANDESTRFNVVLEPLADSGITIQPKLLASDMNAYYQQLMQLREQNKTNTPAWIYLDLGQIQEIKNHRRKAVEFYRKAADAAKTDQDRNLALQRIARLEKRLR